MYMKKILILFLLLMIIGGVCSADPNWMLISQDKDTTLYLDIDSITSATLNGNEIKQFKVKMVSKLLNNYRLDLTDVKQDTKDWLVIHEDRFNNKGVLTETHNYSTDQHWNDYHDPLWKPVLDKVLARPQAHY